MVEAPVEEEEKKKQQKEGLRRQARRIRIWWKLLDWSTERRLVAVGASGHSTKR
jgi:hypothetical protein